MALNFLFITVKFIMVKIRLSFYTGRDYITNKRACQYIFDKKYIYFALYDKIKGAILHFLSFYFHILWYII